MLWGRDSQLRWSNSIVFGIAAGPDDHGHGWILHNGTQSLQWILDGAQPICAGVGGCPSLGLADPLLSLWARCGAPMEHQGSGVRREHQGKPLVLD